MAPGILHQLRWRIEPHGLAVQQGAVESGRVVAFDPGGYVHQQGEAGGMGFRESVAGEAANLQGQPLGTFGIVTSFQHAVDQLVPEGSQVTVGFPGGHGTAELIGFAS